MYNSIIVKYGEIGIKGKNRYIFENKLIKNIKNMLKPIDKFNVYKEYGRVYVDLGDYEYDEVVEEVKKVFGVVGVCPAVKVLRNNEEDVESAYNKLKETALLVLEEKISNGVKTFKVESRRGDKSFRLTSQDMSIDIGGNTYDLRVSIIPVVFGEKIVLRILYNNGFNYCIDNLKLLPKQRLELEKIINRNTGLVIVNGPTGYI